MTGTVPLWTVAKPLRETVDPSSLGSQVLHYSIPALEEFGAPQIEDSDSIKSLKLRIRGGELLVSKLNPRKSRILLADPVGLPTVASTEFVAFRPFGADARYLMYLLHSETTRQRLDAGVRSVTRSHQRVEPDVIARLPVPDLPIGEQRRIADFLDAETAIIDGLILAKKRFAMQLGLRMNSLVSGSLFGTSDRLQDTGIPSIGTVPASWTITRNKNLFREVVDLSDSGNETLLTVSHLTGITPRSEKDVTMFMAESLEGYKRVQRGDLVINTMWAWMGALGISPHDGIVSPAYGVYRSIANDVHTPYFDLLYRSPEYVCEMTRHSKGVWSSRLRLYPEAFLALNVPIPPIEDQIQIVRTIVSRSFRDSAVASAVERSIELLLERRGALITAAVTGQVNVTSATGRSSSRAVVASRTVEVAAS